MDKNFEINPRFRYFPKPTEAVLILIPSFEDNAKEIFSNSNIKVISLGERHIGAVIGSQLHQKEYTSNAVETWKNKLTPLFKLLKPNYK